MNRGQLAGNIGALDKDDKETGAADEYRKVQAYFWQGKGRGEVGKEKDAG